MIAVAQSIVYVIEQQHLHYVSCTYFSRHNQQDVVVDVVDVVDEADIVDVADVVDAADKEM